MNVPERWLFSGAASLASQVHAAAVNGHKSVLLKQIAGNPDLKNKEDQFGRTPLMYCVLADRLDCAEALLKIGTDVNKADCCQRTALHLAAQKGNYRFMKLLLARRANWMKKDLEEIIPLHLTTRHKSPKCLALLLKYMAPREVDTQDKNKQTALHWSAYYNNPEHVKLLIKHDSNIGIPDTEGKIPLHWAANHKDPSAVHTVKCILDAAPTESLLNWQDYEGRTPLHFAVADGNVAVADLLTSYEGCNGTSYDNLFRTPLHWAALLGHAQIVHLLLERNKLGTILSDSQGATPLHYAAQSNFAETVEAFLKHPSVKDDSDLEGRTSFMWAAGKGSDDVIQAMLNLKLDIDINLADKYGGTALHAAALSGHVSTVQLLLQHDAQVDATDVMKHTPLFRACEMGHKDVIQTLIKGGARVDLIDQDGHSPLHWAALGGNPDVCQALIENKINPNVQDYAGRTPLQCAAYGGYINCMVVLLENGADPNIQDQEGRTALHWLCSNGYLDAVKLLLGFGAFPNHMENNDERYTPLDYALLGAHHEVIQFMLEHGALSIAAIQDIAAVQIQAVYKGYKVRKAFQDRKILLMKHEQLRKDAAAKKREEENRRKATELQKEMGSSSRRQQPQGGQFCLLEKEKTQPRGHLHTPQGNASSNSSQNQPRQSRRGSVPVLPRQATNAKTRCLSLDLLRGDPKNPKDSKCGSPSTCLVSVTNSKENQVSRPQVEAVDRGFVDAANPNRQAVSAAAGKEDVKHKELAAKARGTFTGSRKKRVPSNKAASSREQLENQSRSLNSNVSHCEGAAAPAAAAAACAQTNAGTRHSKPCEMALQGSPQELSPDRWSPAGSSRPGSRGGGTLRRDEAASTNKAVTKGDVPSCGGTPGLLAPHRLAVDGGCADTAKWKKAADQMQPMSTNSELPSLDVRKQLIEKERERKQLFRKKNSAALIIQRAWRSHHLRRRFLHLLSAKRQCNEEEDKWRQETAAFCIEVAWKKQLSPPPPPGRPNCSVKALKSRDKSRSTTINSSHKLPTLKQIYGRFQDGRLCRPGRPPPSKHNRAQRQGLSESGLQYLRLQENTGEFNRFSYHMRPTATVQPKLTRFRHDSKPEL